MHILNSPAKESKMWVVGNGFNLYGHYLIEEHNLRCLHELTYCRVIKHNNKHTHWKVGRMFLPHLYTDFSNVFATDGQIRWLYFRPNKCFITHFSGYGICIMNIAMLLMGQKSAMTLVRANGSWQRRAAWCPQWPRAVGSHLHWWQLIRGAPTSDWQRNREKEGERHR